MGRALRGLGALLLAPWLALAGPAAVAQPAAAAPGAASLQIELGGHAAPVRRLAASPRLGLVVTASDDKTARVWDLATHELRQVLRPAVGAGEVGRLYGAAFHPREPLVAVAGSTGAGAGGHRILLFQPETGALVRAFDARGGDVKDLAYTPDGRLLLAVYAGDNALRAFDPDGRMVFEQRLGGLAYGVAVSADGRVAAATLEGTVHLFRASDGRIVADGSLRGSGRPVSMAFSPDGSRLLVGYFDPAPTVVPEVFDLASRRSVMRLAAERVEAGNLMTVAFTEDGRYMLAGGTGYRRPGEHLLQVFDAGSGRLVGQHLLATNSIFDLAALGGGRVAYAAFDGTWGVLDLASGRVKSTGAGLSDLRGPSLLKISPDASRVAFSFDFGRTVSVFDVAGREIRGQRADDGLVEPTFKRGFFGGPTWENTREPRINGASVRLAGDEVGRSIAYLHDSDEALFGSSKALYAIGAGGGTRWRVTTGAEVLAINVRRDNAMAVTAMSDGTLRWWRTNDGALVLTLLPRADGRWVMFSPDGQFDASAGADRIVGWSVNRDDGVLADFFSLNRFRDQFNRPQAIDNLLGLAIRPDPVASGPGGTSQATDAQGGGASGVAPGADATGATAPAVSATQGAAGAAGAPSGTGEPARSSAADTGRPGATAATGLPPGYPVPPTPASVNLKQVQFPPVLSAVELTRLRPTDQAVRIPFTIRAKGRPEVEVRIDGRPEKDARVRLPASFTGRERAIVEVPSPPPGTVIQLIARDEHGVSEPLGFKIADPEPAAQSAPVVTVPPVVEPVTAEPLQVAVAKPAALPAATGRPPPAAPAPATRGPRLFVLAVGISEYARPDYRLGLADKDSRDFVRTVASQRGQYYADVQTRVLNNGDATRAAIMEGLNWLASQVGPDDVGMLFMAGHGVNAPDGQYYFMPYEGRHEQLAATSVPEDAIRGTLGRMRGRALFFVDTCYAGNALGNFRTASRELAKLANNLAATENGVVVFASSSGRQLSEENDAWGNGAFTKALIEGLSGKADLTRSGRITYKGLDYYVSDQVSRLTDGRQTPVTISPIGVPDFAIAQVQEI